MGERLGAMIEATSPPVDPLDQLATPLLDQYFDRLVDETNVARQHLEAKERELSAAQRARNRRMKHRPT